MGEEKTTNTNVETTKVETPVTKTETKVETKVETKPDTKVETKTSTKEASIDANLLAIAWEVKSGQYGTGETCTLSLKKAGYDPKAVMDVVKTLNKKH